MAKLQNVIMFYFKNSGQSGTGNKDQIIMQYFDEKKISLETIYLPMPEEEIKEIISKGINNEVDLFIAAGGDGTVSLVSNFLNGTEKKLAILPLGTGNLLAKELLIPQKLEDALELITSSDAQETRIDTMRMDGSTYILNVSVGVTPKIMEQTVSSDKQRLGIFAYLFQFFQQVLGLKLHRFYLDFDNQSSTYLASEILITNGRSIGIENLKWSENISLNDGELDIFIIRAANIYDILSLLISIFRKNESLNPVIKMLKCRNYCRIDTQKPTRIQADGDPIGKTPLEITIHPQSLSIIAGNNYQSGKD